MFQKICLILLLLTQCIVAEAIFQPQKPGLFIVDDFEDADLSQFPRWWGFDNIDLSIEPNNMKEFAHLGKRSIQLTGAQKNWYVGGCGTYFGIDVAKFNAIKLLVRGYGKKSAVLIVELFELKIIPLIGLFINNFCPPSLVRGANLKSKLPLE